MASARAIRPAYHRGWDQQQPPKRIKTDEDTDRPSAALVQTQTTRLADDTL